MGENELLERAKKAIVEDKEKLVVDYIKGKLKLIEKNDSFINSCLKDIDELNKEIDAVNIDNVSELLDREFRGR